MSTELINKANSLAEGVRAELVEVEHYLTGDGSGREDSLGRGVDHLLTAVEEISRALAVTTQILSSLPVAALPARDEGLVARGLVEAYQRGAESGSVAWEDIDALHERAVELVGAHPAVLGEFRPGVWIRESHDGSPNGLTICEAKAMVFPTDEAAFVYLQQGGRLAEWEDNLVANRAHCAGCGALIRLWPGVGIVCSDECKPSTLGLSWLIKARADADDEERAAQVKASIRPRALALLSALEWSADVDLEEGGYAPGCPVCGGRKPGDGPHGEWRGRGHVYRCELQAVLCGRAQGMPAPSEAPMSWLNSAASHKAAADEKPPSALATLRKENDARDAALDRIRVALGVGGGHWTPDQIADEAIALIAMTDRASFD